MVVADPVDIHRDQLLQVAGAYLGPKHLKMVEEAIDLGIRQHEGQIRKSGEPYITHPIQVASILAEIRLDRETIIAAILHDTIEDTDIEREDIAGKFGEQVAALVDGVTKLDRMKFRTREEATAESFRKMMLAMSEDIRVIMIKLADRLHNMRTISAMSQDSRRRISRETLEIYAPIAHRLGMNQFKTELQELGFAGLHPMRHRIIRSYLRRNRANQDAVLEKIKAELQVQFANAGIEAEVSGRLKTPYSVFQKMKSKGNRLKSIMDVLGFRVVVERVEQCYHALGIAHNLYQPVPGLFKDYVAMPKPNGYQSLHTVLFGPYRAPIEIQIRTRDMDIVAERGIAAHWSYKSDTSSDSTQKRAREWLLSLLENQKQAGNSEEFLESVKVDLFPEQVYVFTPKGKIITLPRDACALDFAYEVHTGVGNHAVAAWIDNNHMPLGTRLQTGQTVRIVTAASSGPRPEWLEMISTTKARTAIRHYLKNMEHEQSIEMGHRMLDRALGQMGFSLESIREEELVAYLQECHFKRLEELLADIAMGNRMPKAVARQLLGNRIGIDNSSGEALFITGREGGVVSYGQCCHPIPGDDIMGHLSAGKGIVLHTRSCPNINEFRKSPDRWIDCSWDSEVSGDFTVPLKVVVENRPGALATTAAVISEAGSNIEEVEYLDRDQSVATILFLLEVHGRVHLARIIRRLRRIPLVTRAARA